MIRESVWQVWPTCSSLQTFSVRLALFPHCPRSQRRYTRRTQHSQHPHPGSNLHPLAALVAAPYVLCKPDPPSDRRAGWRRDFAPRSLQLLTPRRTNRWKREKRLKRQRTLSCDGVQIFTPTSRFFSHPCSALLYTPSLVPVSQRFFSTFTKTGGLPNSVYLTLHARSVGLHSSPGSQFPSPRPFSTEPLNGRKAEGEGALQVMNSFSHNQFALHTKNEKPSALCCRESCGMPDQSGNIMPCSWHWQTWNTHTHTRSMTRKICSFPFFVCFAIPRALSLYSSSQQVTFSKALMVKNNIKK